ncbi:MAG: sulfite exporter TauE/SafE family protein [Microscillaceae bacterium]|jgi:hypothetical protein|nr:sulfite exporter TauE/SafE family protein [Microscillaceae bacterium]
MIEILAYFSALAIGFVLGLFGGGGAILTMPTFVYLVGINPVASSAYSLFVIGSSSLVGSMRYYRKGWLNLEAAVVFALPSVITVFLMRKFVVPAIPKIIFQIDKFLITKDLMIMLIFALVMLFSAISMLRNQPTQVENENDKDLNYYWLFVQGVLVGLIAGLVGAGGGFLIVPALVMMANLPMRVAIGTSLLIIASNSLIGFLGDLGNAPIQWQFLLTYSAMTIVGVLGGTYANRFIPAENLKKGFGVLVLLVGMMILWKEIF